ncbi:hypothetical protein RCO27_18005 [Sphingosinicella sp. LHD-64]|uniref:hypothetical protein n=1 Tax=Sphingosinicella sp. LHD-64 TaxID=3072139 RepID=UPI00280DD6E1|nr:hypothetical protein [Sphingosinicella sp. LHD-64]MDQ8758124.1 hypothetical protein [Sphingosinicella sp. LHD-64]
MDLNHLIHREGEERVRAAQASSDEARAAHVALADLFRDRIDFRRRTMLDGVGLGSGLRPPAL